MQDFFDILDGKISIWRKMVKHNISSMGPAQRLHYIPNSEFQAKISKLNQYLL